MMRAPNMLDLRERQIKIAMVIATKKTLSS
jgi:hypothetical protein